jgi:hypothetical protein
MARIRPGDQVAYCGVEYLVATVYKGEAELTTLAGTVVDYIPVHALHRIGHEKARPPSGRRSRDFRGGNGYDNNTED